MSISTPTICQRCMILTRATGASVPRKLFSHRANGASLSIVKDNAQCVTVSGAKPADAVAHFHAIDAFCALDRALVDGKDHRIALTQRNDFGAALHPRPLLGEDEFAALE